MNFERHRDAAVRLYPAVSLVLVFLLFAGTGDSTLVLLALLAGHRLIAAAGVLPDIDTPRSKARRLLGRVITGGLVAFVALSVLSFLFPGVVVPVSTRVVHSHQATVGLVLGLLLWVGVSSRHRSLTHSLGWAGAVAVGVGVLGGSVLGEYGGLDDAVAFGGTLAAYSFCGIYLHLDLDGERSLAWEPDDRSFTDYRQYLERTARQYPAISLPVLSAGIVFVDSSVVLLLVLVAGYAALVAGCTLPQVAQKRSRPRRVFDRAVSVLLAGLLLQQGAVLVPGLEHPGAVVLPAGTVPSFALLAAVLWVGRNSRPERMTYSVAWPAAVAATAMLFLYTATAGLPTVESVVVASGVGSYLLGGLHHHLRVEGAL